MIIEPRILKGFRDSLPKQERIKRDLIHSLEMQFRTFGFEPIDTPALEYTDVLLGKGSGETDKQIYRFLDNGKRDVSMRFDLTVPFARFMAAHINELYEPFKRYHIAKVWRGENTQKGRFREFYQCDFDIVGVDSMSADFEILLMMYQSLTAIGLDSFTIKVSHRGLFNTFLAHNGIQEQSAEILRTVDKLSKIGETAVREQLCTLTDVAAADRILSFISCGKDFKTAFASLTSLSGGPSEASERLEQIFGMIDELGLNDYFELDASITRGLDYYTGIVYETILTDLPSIGSICSGGRYNELASLYTKRSIPGVGASIGLDRLLAALEELESSTDQGSMVDLIIFALDEHDFSRYHHTAQQLRARGLHVEVFPTKKKLQQQFKYAQKKEIPFGLFIGEDEAASETFTMKNLIEREAFEHISIDDAYTIITSHREHTIDKS
ncbi:MAG: histidine--tRNA ligase [Spirochaetia bacterium]|nr:histidine--tRNA ligase [Spirochaetia bacterium]MCF7940188.1 histidine--tRNA ligase [Spirochaetia bacterium]